jgi:hypothetical protein
VYEAPEADVLLRKPRKPKVDRLVDWKLMLQSYGFIGVLETVSSFAMSYWYLERNGIAFSDLWFGYGTVPTNVDQLLQRPSQRGLQRVLCQSRRHAVVLPDGAPHPSSQHLPAPATLQQPHAELVPVPGYALGARHVFLLAVYPEAADHAQHHQRPSGAFLPACCLRAGHFVLG